MRVRYLAMGALIFGWALLVTVVTRGQDLPHEHKRGEKAIHGGQVATTKEFHFEVVFLRDAIEVHVHDAKMSPVDLGGVKGEVRVAFEDKAHKPVKAPLAAVDEKPGTDAGRSRLRAAVDFSEVGEGAAEAEVRLEGLPGKKEKKAVIRKAFRLARLVEYACPMACVEPLEKPGECPKCGMALEERRTIYACPMHPEVTSRKEDATCWECGMKLAKTTSNGDGSERKRGHGGKHHH